MTDNAMQLSTPGAVNFLDTGVVTPSKPSAIIASLSDPHSVFGEELRLLRSRLRDDDRSSAARCLALTSALPAEGKSTLALGLAAAYAREPRRRVLLLEADIRRPSLSDSLGLPRAPGLSEWLNGGLGQVPIRRMQPAGLWLLVAGQEPLERPESLGSPLMDALLRSARSAFDDVLLDVPPLLPVADSILMQELLDGFLLVVRSRVTPREAIHDALGRLRPEKIVGVVLNDQRTYRHSYLNYAYERYSGSTARAATSAAPDSGGRSRADPTGDRPPSPKTSLSG